MSGIRPDPFDGLDLDEEFIRGAAIYECDLEFYRARMSDSAFWCPSCTRRRRRRQRWRARTAGTTAAAMSLGAVTACMGSAAFASLVACGAL